MSIKIRFSELNIDYDLRNGGGPIGAVAHFILSSKIFNLLTLGWLHTLVHEMGHAVAYKILTGEGSTITLCYNSCYGSTAHDGSAVNSPIKETWILLSGPLANIIFSSVLIVGIFALTQYLPMAKEVSLGLRIAITANGAIWMIGELFYAAVSVSQKDDGDFGRIAKEHWLHLTLSTLLLIIICALCILGVMMIVNGPMLLN